MGWGDWDLENRKAVVQCLCGWVRKDRWCVLGKGRDFTQRQKWILSCWTYFSAMLGWWSVFVTSLTSTSTMLSFDVVFDLSLDGQSLPFFHWLTALTNVTICGLCPVKSHLSIEMISKSKPPASKAAKKNALKQNKTSLSIKFIVEGCESMIVRIGRHWTCLGQKMDWGNFSMLT